MAEKEQAKSLWFRNRQACWLIDNAMGRSGVTYGDLSCILKLWAHAQPDGRTFVGDQEIAKALGTSERQIQKSIARLVAAGLLIRESGGGRGIRRRLMIQFPEDLFLVKTVSVSDTVSDSQTTAKSDGLKTVSVSDAVSDSETTAKSDGLFEKTVAEKSVNPGRSGRKTSAETDTRTEYRTVDGTDIPPCLQTRDFLQAWQEWWNYRCERKKKLTQSTVKKQIAQMAAAGPQAAIAAIERSIASGWIGVFVDAGNGSQKGSNNGRNRPEAIEEHLSITSG